MPGRTPSRSLLVHQVLSASALTVLWVVVVSTVAHAQSGAPSLGPVERIVEMIWNLEKRAIEQGQIAAGALFGGLATIHLMVVALQALNRGDSLGQFQEQLLWTGAFGSAIGLGPAWARAIVDFFRNVGRSVSHGQVTPQRFVDLVIELLDSAHSAGGWLFDFIAGAVYLCIAILAGLIALVVLYQETESHVILGAGAVVLGFGGAAATRDIAIRYFRLALGSGLRLMLVEMINGAVMDTLIAGVEQAKTEKLEGLETAATLMLGMLIVLGFILILPIVVHSLSSGAISSTAETLLAGLPAMAAAGGVAKMMGGSLGGLVGGRASSGKSGGHGGKSAEGASAISASVGQGQGKGSGRGGAVPGKEAVAGGRGTLSASSGSHGGGQQADGESTGARATRPSATTAATGGVSPGAKAAPAPGAGSSSSASTARQGAPGAGPAGGSAAPHGGSGRASQANGARAPGGSTQAGSASSATLPPSYWNAGGSGGADDAGYESSGSTAGHEVATGPEAESAPSSEGTGQTADNTPAEFTSLSATRGASGSGAQRGERTSASPAQSPSSTQSTSSTTTEGAAPQRSMSGRQSDSPSAVSTSSAAGESVLLSAPSSSSSVSQSAPIASSRGASGSGAVGNRHPQMTMTVDQPPPRVQPGVSALSAETFFHPKGGASE